MNSHMPIDARRALIAVLRTDFVAFVHKVFNEICPGDKFLSNWHIEAICHHLELALSGQSPRLIINMPPRYLKSIIASVAFPAWLLGKDPTLRVICVSYSDELARKFSRDFRRVVEAPWYRQVFPQTILNPQKISESEIVTTKNGFRLATSIGGTLTGRGGNIIIIDDPMKPIDSESEAERKRVNEWFDSTLISRLDDKVRGIIVVVMQRLHQLDLTGYLLEKPGWNHLSLPAIALMNQSIPIGHGRIYNREEGEVLHAKREPFEVVERRRLEVSGRIFSAQYQQDPVPAEGAMIKVASIKYSPAGFSPESSDLTYQSWDIAAKAGTGNDYSVGTTWVTRGNEIHLADVRRVRLEFPDLLKEIQAYAKLHSPKAVLIEDANTGTAVIQSMNQQTNENVIPIKPSLEKRVRVGQASVMFEAGRVYLRANADWHADYLSELLAFPNGRFDDQVDSTSQFLNWWADAEQRQIPVVFPILIPRSDPWPFSSSTY